MKLHVFSCTLALALAAVPAFATARINTAQRFLDDMHENALKASDNATTASAYSAMDGMDWQGYLPYLSSLKNDINRMGKDLAHLKAMPEMESPAARQALRRVEPLLKQAALQADQATEFFNAHHDTLWQPHYVNQLKSISTESNRIAALLHDARQIPNLQQREAALRRDLSASKRH